MAVYVTDTHPLVWYASGRHKKLSRKALRIFSTANEDQALIYVPAVVLWEVSMLIKSGVVALRDSFDLWASALLAKRGFDLAPLDVEVMTESLHLSFSNDPFDVAIVATARVKDLPLITADADIADANIVEIAW